MNIQIFAAFGMLIATLNLERIRFYPQEQRMSVCPATDIWDSGRGPQKTVF